MRPAFITNNEMYEKYQSIMIIVCKNAKWLFLVYIDYFLIDRFMYSVIGMCGDC